MRLPLPGLGDAPAVYFVDAPLLDVLVATAHIAHPCECTKRLGTRGTYRRELVSNYIAFGGFDGGLYLGLGGGCCL